MSFLRGLGLEPIDLCPALVQFPKEQLEQGYDGTHYGPQTQHVLAGRIELALREGHLVR